MPARLDVHVIEGCALVVISTDVLHDSPLGDVIVIPGMHYGPTSGTDPADAFEVPLVVHGSLWVFDATHLFTMSSRALGARDADLTAVANIAYGRFTAAVRALFENPFRFSSVPTQRMTRFVSMLLDDGTRVRKACVVVNGTQFAQARPNLRMVARMTTRVRHPAPPTHVPVGTTGAVVVHFLSTHAEEQMSREPAHPAAIGGPEWDATITALHQVLGIP